MSRSLRDLTGHRELLAHLVLTDLKLRYRNSLLGFLWTLLTPALTLAVFYLVFALVLQGSFPYYWLYLLSGLTVWNLFSSALAGATSSIVANGGLVKKVALPGHLFVLAATLSATVDSLFQFVILGLALAVAGRPVSLSFAALLAPALLVVVVVATGAGLILALHNVRFRDVRHVVDLLLLPWFWLTPVVYPYGVLSAKLGGWRWVAFLNPVTIVVVTFQRALYDRVRGSGGALVVPPAGVAWYALRLAVVGGVGVALVVAGAVWLNRRQGLLAEEL